MKKLFCGISIIALSVSFTSLVRAEEQCRAQKRAVDSAYRDYTRAEASFSRLQQQSDSKADQDVYRRARLEGAVVQAQANLDAAKTGSLGQGIRCLLAPRGGCLGQTTSRIMQQIARAKAIVRAQQGRLKAFERAMATQMTRLSKRVSKQEELLKTKKGNLDQKEAAYNSCMSNTSSTAHSGCH